MCAKERLPRKHYSPEFKMELVRLALEEEGSIAALARKHDVNDNLLFKWIRLWQREGRVCRPRKNSSSLPALIPVQLQAGASIPSYLSHSHGMRSGGCRWSRVARSAEVR